MIKKIIRQYKLGEEPTDFFYWKDRSPQERLDALESIREEYNQWKYSDAEQRFQRILKVTKRK